MEVSYVILQSENFDPSIRYEQISFCLGTGADETPVLAKRVEQFNTWRESVDFLKEVKGADENHIMSKSSPPNKAISKGVPYVVYEMSH